MSGLGAINCQAVFGAVLHGNAEFGRVRFGRSLEFVRSHKKKNGQQFYSWQAEVVRFRVRYIGVMLGVAW